MALSCLAFSCFSLLASFWCQLLADLFQLVEFHHTVQASCKHCSNPLSDLASLQEQGALLLDALLGGQQLLSWANQVPVFFWEGQGQQRSLSLKFDSCIYKSSPHGGVLVVVDLHPPIPVTCYLLIICHHAVVLLLILY
jgi:hypothetical protein